MEKEHSFNAGDAWEIAIGDGIEEELNNTQIQHRAKRAYILGYMDGGDRQQGRIISEVQALDVTEFNNPMSLKLAVIKIIKGD